MTVGPILDVSLVDPVPVTGHDVQYPPGMHLARVQPGRRLHAADRPGRLRVRVPAGRPWRARRWASSTPSAWGDERLVPYLAVSASFAACDMTIANVRYICNPDIPASEGTEKVSDK